MFTLEQIVACRDLIQEQVEIPEWAGTVCIRVMSGLERSAWWTAWKQAEERKDIPFDVMLAAHTLCDEDGKLLFAGDYATGYAIIGGKCSEAISRISNAAFELNKLGASAVESAEKNSE
jgi:hypothetical protein